MLLQIFFRWTTPKLVFFDDFCDLLPNRIFISDLNSKNTKADGYQAVRNLERILNIDFSQKDQEDDAIRRTKEESDNEFLSVDFQKDWGQRIHGENKIDVKYIFEKRSGDGVNGSYVKFFVQTKKGEPLPPSQRKQRINLVFITLARIESAGY